MALDIITIGGVTVSLTLGGGTVTVTRIGEIVGTSIGNNKVWVFSGCMVLNICANFPMACNWLSSIVKGFFVPGFLITCIGSLAALVD